MARYRNSSWRQFDPDAPRGNDATVFTGATSCRILGLDPGSLRTGWGVVDVEGPLLRFVAAGCIRTPSGPLAPRLLKIHAGITTLLGEHAPGEIAIERVFLSRNPDSALKLGQARGVAMCAAAAGGAPVFEYAPSVIKQALVGTGSAEKLQVAHMVRALLQVQDPLGLDATDALAAALCHGLSRRLNALVAGARA
ncbi:MAG: crossover junction endodeoxyribonuclease RuvC [Pseudomonadota bacterium]|jgi:crossover junction endodeoxyribonuclease RuvC